MKLNLQDGITSGVSIALATGANYFAANVASLSGYIVTAKVAATIAVSSEVVSLVARSLFGADNIWAKYVGLVAGAGLGFAATQYFAATFGAVNPVGAIAVAVLALIVRAISDQINPAEEATTTTATTTAATTTATTTTAAAGTTATVTPAANTTATVTPAAGTTAAVTAPVVTTPATPVVTTAAIVETPANTTNVTVPVTTPATTTVVETTPPVATTTAAPVVPTT